MKRKTEKQKKHIVKMHASGKTIQELHKEFNVPQSTLYSWIKQYKTYRTRYGTVTPKDLDSARRRIKKLEDLVAALQSSPQIANMTTKEKEQAIDAQYGKYSVHTLCEAFNLSTGTFYNYKLRAKGKDAWYKKRRAELKDQIHQIYKDSHYTYGVRRIRAALQRKGYRVSERIVLELMHELNISGSRIGIKRTHHLLGVAEKRTNKLMQCFDVSSPNTVWVSDMTSIDLKNRRIYVCAYLDLYSRKIVSVRCGYSCSTNLALAAIRDAIANERPHPGLTVHTDNGGAFVSYSMNRLIRHYGFKQSFSRPGIPQDNSVMESFFNTLKQEFLYRHEFRSETEFRTKLSEYLNYYNTERLHEYLGYKTPAEVTSSYYILESVLA